MKILISIALLCVAFASNSQTQDFNKWSVGLGIGMHDGMAPMKGNTKAYQIHHYGLNGRYMINNRFGIMLDVGYDFFDYEGSGGRNPHYFRTSIQGVVNVGDMIKLNTLHERLGLLVHGGAGLSQMWLKKEYRPANAKDPLFNGVDDMLNYIFGIRPQFKINERVSLNADVSFIFHHNQTQQFDMNSKSNHGAIDGYFLNFSIGASFYLGKHKTHADWVPTVYGGKTNTEDLAKRVKELEESLKDDDQDGVPNSRDMEPDTPKDSYVNSKGEAIVEREVIDLDKDDDGFLDTVDECPEVVGKINGCPDRDNDGIPDHLDECPDEFGSRELNGCALTKVELEEIKVASEAIFFNTGKSEIKSESFSALNKMADILNNNPQVKVMIEGHTDDTGNEDYNLNLSKERAAAVVDYLSSKGVNRARMQSEGYGATKPVASNDTEEGRTQNRRVKIVTTTFKK